MTKIEETPASADSRLMALRGTLAELTNTEAAVGALIARKKLECDLIESKSTRAMMLLEAEIDLLTRRVEEVQQSLDVKKASLEKLSGEISVQTGPLTKSIDTLKEKQAVFKAEIAKTQAEISALIQAEGTPNSMVTSFLSDLDEDLRKEILTGGSSKPSPSTNKAKKKEESDSEESQPKKKKTKVEESEEEPKAESESEEEEEKVHHSDEEEFKFNANNDVHDKFLVNGEVIEATHKFSEEGIIVVINDTDVIDRLGQLFEKHSGKRCDISTKPANAFWKHIREIDFEVENPYGVTIEERVKSFTREKRGNPCSVCGLMIKKGKMCTYGFKTKDKKSDLCMKHPLHLTCAAFLKSLMTDSGLTYPVCLGQAKDLGNPKFGKIAAC